MISARAARKVECQSSACDSSRPLPESYLDVPSTLNSLECERMSTSAVVNLTDATRQEPVRDELWKHYQALKKSHGRGTAKWRSEWEVVLYKPGDIRKDKPLEEGALFYRHIPCRAEYGTSNLPRTHKEHNCEKASGAVCEAMQYRRAAATNISNMSAITGTGPCCSSR